MRRLPLELVGEEGWLIFTCSLKRWGRLRRTNRILKHKTGGGETSIMSCKIHQSYSWEGRLQKALSVTDLGREVTEGAICD